MNEGKFFFSLAAMVLLCSLFTWKIQGESQISGHTLLSYAGIFCFALHNVIFYYLAKKFSATSQDRRYIGMVYLSVLTKLVIAVALPVSYYFLKGQPTATFVFPFIILYVAFTVFETYVLHRMAIMR